MTTTEHRLRVHRALLDVAQAMRQAAECPEAAEAALEEEKRLARRVHELEAKLDSADLALAS